MQDLDGAGVVVEGLVGGYVDGLVGRGVVRSAGVERAFRAVPRHWFVERFWVGGREFACGVEGEDGWVEALGVVYSDEALITRRDDEGNPTSSASQPSVVAMMLEALDLEPGMRVLEIGSGTGYNAALMAEMVGDARLVTTIDIDADVVAQTGRLLGRAGYGGVNLVRGDGALGHAASGPFDRIVATVGCSDVAWAWADQLGPDGVLLLPLEHGGSHPLVKLRAAGTDRLCGGVVGWTGFMRIRGEMAMASPWPGRFPDFDGRAPDEALPLFPALSRALAGEPSDVDRKVEWWRMPGAWYDFHFLLCLIDRRAYRGPEGLGLVDVEGARAAVMRADGVCVWGGSGLYECLEAAYAVWEGLGMPGLRSWRIEFVPRGVGVADCEGSDGVFMVERGMSWEVLKKGRG